MHVTLNASVLVSAYLASDFHHSDSLHLLGALIEAKVDLNVPTLVLSEVATALARNTREPERGLAAIELIEQTPGVRLHPLSLPLARRPPNSRALASYEGAQKVKEKTR